MNTPIPSSPPALTATVFDIKEFAVHDGPGVRVTVFLKGCPLRCLWCHNPEGLSPKPELIKNKTKCTSCGLCERSFPCRHKECQPYGVCLKVCPQNLLRVSGKTYTVEELVARLKKYEFFFKSCGGGVTFSGGEPTMQGEFVAECAKALREIGINTAIETSAFCKSELFARIIENIDEIYVDIKEMDCEKHKLLTGVDNTVILSNISYLMDTGRTFTVRMPLIPGVNDSDGELKAAAEFLVRAKDRVKVELLPYNTLTGAKYALIGKQYSPTFDESARSNTNTEIFTALGISCTAQKNS